MYDAKRNDRGSVEFLDMSHNPSYNPKEPKKKHKFQWRVDIV
jgi:hypothetical protein